RHASFRPVSWARRGVKETGAGAGHPGDGRTFRDLGLDSVAAAELRNRLAEATGLALPPTVVYDHPTPGDLARRIVDDALGRHPDQDHGAGAGSDAGHGTGLGAGRDADDARNAAPEEPIAIVAMSCRLPGGVRTPEDLWRLLTAGGDAVAPLATDRGWDAEGLYDPDPGVSGRYYQREAGLLEGAAGFDAAFFGISPREALAMDPQQRLLLETAWEVFERAGIDPVSVRGSATGTYVGAMAQDYGPRLHESAGESHGYLLTGNAVSVASGRLAYTFGLEGPAVTVDTACSSSLVALHLAVQALRGGECRLALAGGATVMPSPGMLVEFSQQRALAPDGRCKAFSAAADGFGLAEGAGMLLLERLSDARRNGHQVLAVVRGTAINQDGASNGLTAPSGRAQQRVIRSALANAGVSAADVDAVEAHGTGTRLGDPIEAQALLATYGRDRPAERPLWLGSLKSNIGHAQAAAGVAGVIKTVLALRHGVLPKSLHITEPTSAVDWSAGAVRLLDEEQPWAPREERPRRAGVSSFGISGTNAHAVIEEAPETAVLPGAPVDPPRCVDPVAVPLVLSARSAEALREQAGRLAGALAGDGEPVDVAHALVTTRATFDHRAVVVGADRDELTDALRAFAAGQPVSRAVSGAARPGVRPVFVFPGQGSQWAGMAVELLDDSPEFRERMAACEAALAPHVEWSLDEVLRQAPGAPELEAAEVVQPVLWAVMVSLAGLWRAAGVEPAAVVGHSQGEIAAACVAGALSLPDAARIVALRSRLLARIAGRGGMASVAAPAEAVRERLTGWEGRLGVAAVNGPGSVVVSGDADALDAFLTACEQDGVRARRVPVDYASHSAHVEEIEAELAEALAGITPATPDIAFCSTVTGEPTDAPLDAPYWYTNLRQAVRFEEVTRRLLDDGHRLFVEISPHPVLTVGLQETFEAAGAETAAAIGTLRRGEGGPQRFLLALGQAHTTGADVNWPALTGGWATRPADLPTYPFQHQRYWLDPHTPTATPAGGTTSADEAGFWAAVERHDLPALAGTLDLDPDASLEDLLTHLSRWRHQTTERSATDNWRYRVTWQPLPSASPSQRRTPSGTWLLVVPEQHTADPAFEAAHRALTGHHAHVTVITVAPADDRSALTDRLRAATGPDCAGVVSLLALAEGRLPGHTASTALARTVTLAQALGDADIAAPLWCLTSGAVSTGPADPVRDPAQAQLWGLGRVIALEQPHRWGGLIDLPAPAELDTRAMNRLAGILTDAADEQETALRATGVFGRRLVRAPAGAPRRPDWRPTGTILITGGTGSIGAHVARRPAAEGAEHLLLISRSGPAAPGAAELRAELEDHGTRVTIAACDAADRDALRDLLAGLPPEHPLTGVIHSAGTLDDGILDTLTPDRLDTVLRPKAEAARNLHELTADHDELRLFVLFSSVSGIVGNGGQGGYAAANAYLDALAQHRRAHGLPATSIAWGSWGTGGLVTDAAGERARRRGLLPMSAERAVQAMRGAIDQDDTAITVADIDWKRYAPTLA
ncbi:type I polyketide synthase, partial [Streptomyces specialis]|uniref:type I polyketide synthase n=1 Tax=Streptomyces specialis TaxID=498367 RepID=UPI000B18AE91